MSQQDIVQEIFSQLSDRLQEANVQADKDSIQRNRSHVTISRSEEQKIVLPKGMSLSDAREWLYMREKEQERYVEVRHVIPGYPLDVGHAFFRVLMEMFGFVAQKPTPGFFGDSPPMKVSVRTGPGDGDFVQIPWGRVAFPPLEEREHLNLGAGPTKDGVPSFLIGGEVKRKHEELVAHIAEVTQAYAMTHSVIQNKATRVNLRWIRDRVNFHPETHAPEFLNLTGRRDLIFPRHVERVLKAVLYDRISDTAKNDFLGIDSSTGVLLVGDYGTGKTELALDLAEYATQHGWSFLVVDDVRDLPSAVRIAQTYSSEQHGFVLFAEDVDTAHDSDLKHALQYALDGAEAKQLGRKLITVLTTNHQDRIDPALLRPGRLDQVITLEPADAETAERFIRRFTVNANGNTLLPDGEDVSDAAQEMAGYTPAFLQEVIRLAKSLATQDEDGNFYVTGQDLYDAARNMKAQEEMIRANAIEDVPPTIEEIVAEEVRRTMEVMEDQVDDMHHWMR